MSSAPNATPADPLSRDGLAWPDPSVIAQLANVFFQAPPNQVVSTNVGPGAPVVPPSPTEVPAPSVVTTAAPFTPARLPYGAPDLPPTTIPSVAPTPNVSVPSAPEQAQPSLLPPGFADLPQPGASAGAFGPPSVPSELDLSALPRFLGDTTALVPSAHALAPYGGYDPSAVPGGSAPAQADDLYFVQNGGSLPQTAPGYDPASTTAFSSSTPATPLSLSLPLADDRGVPPAAAVADSSYVSEPPRLGATPEAFQAPAPSPADPHRLSDAASLSTPQAPAPLPSGLQNVPSPGAAGPAAGDALYFVSHGGAHAPLSEVVSPSVAAPANGASAPEFSPQLAPNAGPAAHPFDPYRIKRDFPILQQHVHGKPLIWLDNAATTQKPQSVIDRLTHFYEYENSNIHRAAHALAARSTDAYEAAREKTRRFLKAPSVKDIIFVRGATEAINLVAQSWGRRNVREGDEIVVSWLEHHANIVPWQQLCAEKGAKLRVAPVDDRGQIILEEYEKLLGPRTRIVSVTQVSNALGTVTPVHEMTAMAHRHGARVLIDGAQAVSHMAVDVQSIDCDFYVFSGHKVFGPTGIGVVYGKQEVLEHMPPWQGGGNMIADVTFEKTIYQGPPERFEAGTGNIADAVGLGAAIDYVEAIGMEVIARYEHDLLVYATEKMRVVPGLTFVGTAHEKASVLSFVLDGHRTEDVGKALDREGIAVRAGHHCAQPILRRFGLEATVRPSLAFYNTCADVDTLVAALLRLQAGRGRAN
ncbi:MAG: segregation protein B [Methylocystaceae bacterium]|nr:MAG: segregation protein B [Methylocystaceae bacterium]